MISYAQRELDKIAKRTEKIIELHEIYCDCWKCIERRKFEKFRREAGDVMKIVREGKQ